MSIVLIELGTLVNRNNLHINKNYYQENPRGHVRNQLLEVPYITFSIIDYRIIKKCAKNSLLLPYSNNPDPI